MTRLFRNPNIKVGDKVHIHAEPVQPIGFLGVFPNPDEVGSVAVVTAIITYAAIALDYDVYYKFPNGHHDLCDSQFLEVV